MHYAAGVLVEGLSVLMVAVILAASSPGVVLGALTGRGAADTAAFLTAELALAMTLLNQVAIASYLANRSIPTSICSSVSAVPHVATARRRPARWKPITSV